MHGVLAFVCEGSMHTYLCMWKKTAIRRRLGLVSYGVTQDGEIPRFML